MKLLKYFFIVPWFILASTAYSESLDVSGMYIGEQFGNPVTAQKFLDSHKTGQEMKRFCLLGCTEKKKHAYFVMQNENGVHVWVIDKKTWFSSMKLNTKGEFSGKTNKNTLEGYFEGDIFRATLFWKQNVKLYLVGILSERDKEIKKTLKGFEGTIKTIADLRNQISELELFMDESEIIIKEYEVIIASIPDLEKKITNLNVLLKDSETAIKAHEAKIASLVKQLKVEPKININNLDLSDSVKKGAILWSGPSKKTAKKIIELNEGSRIVTLRRVKDDTKWSLVAIENGRLGYVETQFITSNQVPTDPGPVKPQPTDQDIELYEPLGITEDGILEINATGLTIIKGRFNSDKIKNVKSVTFNKEEGKFKGNRFLKSYKIKSGLNKITIKILTSSGEQYEYSFSIKAP